MEAGEYEIEIAFEDYVKSCFNVSISSNVTITKDVFLFKRVMVSGIVKDVTTGELLKGVMITFTENNTNEIYTSTTNKNGEFEIALPFGGYSVEFNKDGFEYYGRSLTIETDIPISLGTIVLKSIVIANVGTVVCFVEDKETNDALSGVSVTLTNEKTAKKYNKTRFTRGGLSEAFRSSQTRLHRPYPIASLRNPE